MVSKPTSSQMYVLFLKLCDCTPTNKRNKKKKTKKQDATKQNNFFVSQQCCNNNPFNKSDSNRLEEAKPEQRQPSV